MIMEYAITPDVFQEKFWAPAILAVIQDMPVLICDLNGGEWKRYVCQCADRLPSTKKRIILNFIQNFKTRNLLLKENYEIEGNLSSPEQWLLRAINIAKNQPERRLDGIISTADCISQVNDSCSILNSLEELQEAREWWPPYKYARDERSFVEFCKIFGKTFSLSSYIWIIDPYINPSESQWADFCDLLCAIPPKPSLGIDEAKIELHVKIKQELTDVASKNEFTEKYTKLNIMLKNHELSCKVTVWKSDNYGHSRFHNRYILTNLIAIALQDSTDMRGGGIDFKHVMTWEEKEELWKEFNVNSHLREVWHTFKLGIGQNIQ